MLHTHFFKNLWTTMAPLKRNFQLLKKSSQRWEHPTQHPNCSCISTSMQIFSSPFLSSGNCQTTMLQNHRTTEEVENWWIHNELHPSWEVAAGLHFKISLSSAFPYLLVACSEANLLTDSISIVVCWGRWMIDRVSALKREKRMMEG